MIAIFFKHFDQECIFTLKYGFCKIFIKDIETYLLGVALFIYISARFNQNCMKTMKLTDESRNVLEKIIYDTLMSNPENGLGEMGECRDEAKRIVDEWIEEIGVDHPIVSFLNAYILIWDEFTNSPAYSEYFGGTLTKMLQSYCLAHNLPMNASADDLLADIKANNITLDDEICNG